MRLSNKIVLASMNREKFEEMQALLATHPDIELIPAADEIWNADKLQFAERFDTYLENAIAKARLANAACHYPCLSDDSGLEVEALGGKPGVRSHRFATPRAGVTQDQANVELLLGSIRGAASRNARFVCTLVLLVEGIMIEAEGILEGTITDRPRGINGFGYDPVFIPNGHTKTLAEITNEEKNAISHRALAVRALMEKVKSHGIVFAKP